MNKHFITLALLAFSMMGASAQQLSFRKDGTFKIAQFTDTHICAEKPESKNALTNIQATIENEHPDLIIFSGDVVTGEPARKGWNMILEPVSKLGIPFCVVLGNHDAEQDISREEIAKIVTSFPNNLNVLDNQQLGDLVLTIKGSKKPGTQALVYCMDSHDYSVIDTVKGYGWFSFKQIEWYRKTSAQYTQQNGNKPLPALAFFHIPLPEYTTAYNQHNPRTSGKRLEDECPGSINPGMFAAFLESGDVMGTFVGHDHNNDYVAPYYGISLCYGRFSGGKTTYIDIPNGARIVQLNEGEHGFTTWIRERGTKAINRTCCGSVSQKVLYNAFAHNDEHNDRPLYEALDYGFNYVEADVQLINGKLYVAHDSPADTSGLKTLEEMYLKPIHDRFVQNKGKIYLNGKNPFYFMLDFKSDANQSYDALYLLLDKYKEMFSSVESGNYKERAVLLFISGNRPFDILSKEGIRYAFVDGRFSDIGKKISSNLMPVVSNDYKQYFKWNGNGQMPADELKSLRSYITKAHKEGKKLRFWATPDTDTFKQLMLKEGMDIIGTDNPDELYDFLSK